jgi:hypothetical protein
MRLRAVVREDPSTQERHMPSGQATQVAKKPATPPPAVDPKASTRQVGYGLPCSRCKTYFAADLAACPICQCTERVSPTAAVGAVNTVSDEPVPDTATLEREREKFLREFKLQVYSEHVQGNAAASLSCSVESNHQGALAPAEVCKSCYERIQQRVDQMEAALHMDLKEATQVIYNAVWSDQSDPSQSYQNAAQALLAELRKRGGVTLVLGSLQPLPH